MTIKTVAIIGMGALGMMYGCQIADRLGKDAVQFVMDRERYEKNKNRTFFKNHQPCSVNLVCDEAAKPVDLVIVAVKYRSLQSALHTMRNSVGEKTVLMSVMNGINSEAAIGARYGKKNLIYTVAQAMDVLKKDTAITVTTPGILCIGIKAPYQQQALNALVTFLEKVRLPYQVEEDIMHRIWGKFMLNVGVNQTCMAYETGYAGIQKEGEARKVFKGAMREVMTLAAAEGIALTEADFEEYLALADRMAPEGMPSMRCDGILKQPSEVDMFSGTVLRLADSHGLEMPYNQFLYKKIREMEETY